MIVNPHDIQQLTGKHRLFAQIHDEYGPPPNWKRPQGFISLSKIILEQQVSLASAKAHFNKLNGYIPKFSPEEILKLSDKEMLACHISRQKAKYLRELSSAIISRNLDLNKLRNLDETEIRKQLTSIKGIGVWTSDIYLMFCLQAKDIFPIGDIAIVNTIRKLPKAQSREEILKLSEKWKPLRSLATYYLWHHYLSQKKNRD
jgi:DNA-3-methyladenine glycosylase II